MSLYDLQTNPRTTDYLDVLHFLLIVRKSSTHLVLWQATPKV